MKKKTIGYELIPELINKVNKYSDKLNDRVKIDGIFNQIDLYATDGFKKFIKMSNNRYKYIKSGINLNDFLERQKNEYKELSNNILGNNFYMNNEIENESKKLFKKIGIKESKELIKIRKDIIRENKILTPKELSKRKRYENRRSKNIIQEEISTNEENKLKHNYSIVNKIEEKNSTLIKDKKKYLSEIVEMDKKYLNKNIESYKSFLKDIEKTKDNSKILKIMSKNDNLGHKYSFTLKNIKLLSYKEEKKEIDVIQKKIEEDSKINIKKLMKYTKRGNKKWFEDELKQKSLKRLGYIKANLKRKEDALNDNNINNILHRNYSVTNKNYKNNNNFFNQTTFTNFSNTIKTVKNEAQFIKNIRENFDIKRKTVNKFFKTNSLPTLDEYIIRKVTQKNDISLSPVPPKEEQITLMFNLNIDNSKKKNFDENDKKLRELYDTFKNTYYSKIRSWSLEENEQKEIRKKEKEINEKNKNYINEIKGIKRKAHLFVDIYSLRDGTVNESIKLFNRSLNGPIYSKNNMREKINEFTNYLESKERERLINEELLRKQKIEEEIKLRQEDAEYQVWEKMRKNLNLNNNLNKDEDNIDLVYRYSINSKSKDKSKRNSEQAFRDYLESLQILKEKEDNKKDNENE